MNRAAFLAPAALLSLAACHQAPEQHAMPGKVTAGGFTLTSTSITLPAETQLFPSGPHADAINGNCTGCHSASMVLTQPRLTPEQWQAEVKKMREVYKAPVAEADVPAILAYLGQLPGQSGAAQPIRK